MVPIKDTQTVERAIKNSKESLKIIPIAAPTTTKKPLLSAILTCIKAILNLEESPLTLLSKSPTLLVSYSWIGNLNK